MRLGSESTGRFRTREQAGRRPTAEARKVLPSVLGKDVDATVATGVDEGTYDADRLPRPRTPAPPGSGRPHGETAVRRTVGGGTRTSGPDVGVARSGNSKHHEGGSS